jgi:hypothetical protein
VAGEGCSFDACIPIRSVFSVREEGASVLVWRGPGPGEAQLSSTSVVAQHPMIRETREPRKPSLQTPIVSSANLGASDDLPEISVIYSQVKRLNSTLVKHACGASPQSVAIVPTGWKRARAVPVL